jgi:hypothetical protein
MPFSSVTKPRLQQPWTTDARIGMTAHASKPNAKR